MIYAPTIMTAPSTRVRAGEANSTAQSWLIALALVLVGGQWAHGLLAGQGAPGDTGKINGATGTNRATLETIQIRPNVHVIFGAGGNVTVHVGEDGVILVDSGTEAMADALVTCVPCRCRACRAEHAA